MKTEKPREELVEEVAKKLKKDLDAKKPDSAEEKREIEN